MNVADPEIRSRVLQWLKYADDDLRLARHGLTLKTACPYRLVAFHAQQCAEKHLKAYLVFRGIDFPYTHNISTLLELCAEFASWTETLEDAEELSPFATMFRYPGQEEEVSEHEAKGAIEIATAVRKAVRQALDHEGLRLPESPI